MNDMEGVGNEELREEIRQLKEVIKQLMKEMDREHEYREASIKVITELVRERDARMKDRNHAKDAKQMIDAVKTTMASEKIVDGQIPMPWLYNKTQKMNE